MGMMQVAESDSVVEGEPIGLTVANVPVMIVRFEGKIHAIGDICTHQYALLSDGYFEDGCIECPLHQASFDVRTGEAKCGPANGPAKTFAVEERDGKVFVALDA